MSERSPVARPGDHDPLVEPAWLAARLDDPGLVVVDMRWRQDGSGRARYEGGHVPGAVFLDWMTDIVDPDHRVAFMLAPPERFAAEMERRGIGDATTVVAYADQQGSGPFRLWWAARMHGHEGVRILNGGMDAWLAEGRPLSADPPPPPAPVHWTPRPGADLVAGPEDVAAGSAGRVQVLDSRPVDQFLGQAVWFETGPVPADPDGIARTERGDLRAGRVPWAASVPAGDLYRPDGRMKDPAELRDRLAEAGVGPGEPVVTYCGVGLSAAALLFAVHRAGLGPVRLYDASWEEWGRDPARPVTRG